MPEEPLLPLGADDEEEEPLGHDELLIPVDLGTDEWLEGGDEQPDQGRRAQPRPAQKTRPKFRRRLRRRLTVVLTLFVFLPFVVGILWLLFQAREEWRRMTLVQDEVVLGLAVQEARDWLVESQSRLRNALRDQDVQESIALIRRYQDWPTSRRFVNARKALFRQLEQAVNPPRGLPYYTDFLLIDGITQEVVAATREEWQGKPLDAFPFSQDVVDALIRPDIPEPGAVLHQEVLFQFAGLAKDGEEAYPLGLLTLVAVPGPEEEPPYFLIALGPAWPLYNALLNLQQWLPEGQAFLWDADGRLYQVVEGQRLATVSPNSFWAQLGTLLSRAVRESAPELSLRERLAWYVPLPETQLIEPYQPTRSKVLQSAPTWVLLYQTQMGLAVWLPEAKVGLSAFTPVVSWLAAWRNLAFQGLAIGVFMLVSLVVVAWRLSRSITQPLNQLVQSAERLNQGDWSARVDITTDDEIGLLGYTFNELADNLQELYTTMELELQLRTRQVQLVSDFIDLALEGIQDMGLALRTMLQWIQERFPNLPHTSFLLWDESMGRWVTGARVSQLPRQVQRTLTGLEVRLADMVREQLDWQLWMRGGRETAPLIPEPLVGLAGAPVLLGTRLIGVLIVGTDREDALEPHRADALRLLARQLALILEYWRLWHSEAREDRLLRSGERLLSQLRDLPYPSLLWPTIAQILQQEEARETLLLRPKEGLTDTWEVVYPEDASSDIPPLRGLLPLIAGKRHVAWLLDDEQTPLGQGLMGLAGYARSRNWRRLDVYPIRSVRDADEEGERVLALWVVGTSALYAPSDTFHRIHTFFASTIAWMHYYLDLRRWARIWRIVERVATYAPEAPSEGHLFLRAWDEMLSYLPKVDFFLAQYDLDTQDFVVYVYPSGHHYYHTTITPIERRLIWHVFRTQQALNLGGRHKIISQVGDAASLPTRVPESWVGVPVTLGRRQLGVIGLMDWENPQRFDDEHLTFLRRLAHAFSGLLFYIQRERRLRRRSERERWLRSFIQHISSLTDLQNILDFSVQELRRTFRAHRVRVHLRLSSEATREAQHETKQQGHQRPLPPDTSQPGPNGGEQA
ncbi:MAG: GAF domain-containing protein [Chloroflexi bacterium]|nr:GAF domain-containing protein [Chloroflexota bacterium]